MVDTSGLEWKRRAFPGIKKDLRVPSLTSVVKFLESKISQRKDEKEMPQIVGVKAMSADDVSHGIIYQFPCLTFKERDQAYGCWD
jgi:hypothetical protein